MASPLSWLYWATLALVLILIGLVFREARRRATRRLAADAPRVEAVARAVHAELDSLVTKAEYLTYQCRNGLEAQLASCSPSRGRFALAEAPVRAAFRAACAQFDDARRRVECYNLEHLRGELEAHTKLLLGDEGLNQEQAEAAVRDDTRNLVIAGAGSGKTRVLRARIRYLLVRKTAVPVNRIIALSYTDDAASEVRERLEKVGAHVRASTLHSLGFEIVGRSRGRKPKVVDKDLLGTMIRRMITDADKELDDRFANLIRDALSTVHRDEIEPLDDSGLSRRTLAGETVKSLGEMRIADYLLINGIGYEFEAPARWAPQDATRREYTPDFTIPEARVTIEHWGLRKDGTVPPYFSQTTEDYQEKMRWAREAHHAAKRPLVEMYDHERGAGFEAILEQRLRAAGVLPRPLSLNELKERIPNLSKIEETFAKTLADFVSNARVLRIRPEAIQARAEPFSPRVQAFARCGAEVLRRYEDALRELGQVDFTDMIHEAAEILERGEAGDEYRFHHILVDEFQDLSADRARLIRALLTFGGGKLFAVGDDWQAIFAFSGGNVSYIVNFENHFGPFTLSTLSTNYRSPEAIVEAGTALIEQNPWQIRKEVKASRPTQVPPLVHVVPDDPAAVWERTAELARKELEAMGDAFPPHEPRIMIITRIRKRVHDELRACLRAAKLPNPDGKLLELTSAHSAKGAEAPVVIIADATEDIFGFPCQVEGTDLLLPVRLEVEQPEEEERRLFYVALTRATERLHIVAREGRPSRFLNEIQGEAPAATPKLSSFTHGQRCTLTGTPVQFLSPTPMQRARGMQQLGRLQVGRERVLYKSWRSSGGPILEENRTYDLTDARVEIYQGSPAIVLDRHTRVEPRETMAATLGFEGATPLRVRPRRR